MADGGDLLGGGDMADGGDMIGGGDMDDGGDMLGGGDMANGGDMLGGGDMAGIIACCPLCAVIPATGVAGWVPLSTALLSPALRSLSFGFIEWVFTFPVSLFLPTLVSALAILDIFCILLFPFDLCVLSRGLLVSSIWSGVFSPLRIARRPNASWNSRLVII